MEKSAFRGGACIGREIWTKRKKNNKGKKPQNEKRKKHTKNIPQ